MPIQDGDQVSVHYTGRLESGEVFDSSEGREPLQFTVGRGEVIPGFDNAVRGQEVGDKATATIAPEDAYGPARDELIQEIPKDKLDGDVEPGMRLGLETEDGRQFEATVMEVLEETVRLDFNHFLAGKTLVFDIEVVSVQ